MASSRPAPALQVDMTTEGAPVCQRCLVSLEQGAKLTFVKNKDPMKKGRSCCDKCVNYYLERTQETKHTALSKEQQRGGTLAMLRPDHAAAIRSHNNQAVRGTANTPVRAIGQLSANMLHSHTSNLQPAWKSAVLMPPPSGPSVITPRLLNNMAPAGSLSLLAKLKLPEKAGYQDVHQLFNEMREYMANLAYRSDHIELISIEVTMKVSVPGKVKAMKIANIMETQSNIPVHIGAADLKVVCFYTAMPLFHKWSKGYPLEMEHVKLRDSKYWLEITTKSDVDRDAISSQFYGPVGQSKAKKFKTGQAKLVLELDYEVYQKIVHHRERKLDEEEEEKARELEEAGRVTSHQNEPEPGLAKIAKIDYSHTPSTLKTEPQLLASVRLLTPDSKSVSSLQNIQKQGPQVPSASNVSKVKGAAVSAALVPHKAAEKREREAYVSSNRSQAKSTGNIMTSPQSKRLKVALLGVKPPAQKIIQNLMADHITINVTIFKPQIASWEQLIDPRVVKALVDPMSSVYRSISTSLTFQKGAKPRHGVFKTATFGRSASPIFGTAHGTRTREDELGGLGGGEALCLKQSTYQSSQTGKRKAYDVPTQIANLVVDICCLVWADHLMNLVYIFIEEHEQLQSSSLTTPKVPSLRFVSCGLAVSNNRDTVYLVEELIDEKLEGRFVKYINNSSPKPLLQFLPEEDHINVAHFLCFSQHVQYKVTGGLKTLSDPQIITSPTLGKGLFGEGNVGFESFEEEHECNHFCQFYNLEAFQTGPPSDCVQKLFQTITDLSNESLPRAPVTMEGLHRYIGKGKMREVTIISDDGEECDMDLGTAADKQISRTIEPGEIYDATELGRTK